jgi:A/G-specific adenine glycosylase
MQPQHHTQPYTHGLMHLGPTLCTLTRPAGQRRPLAHRCIAFETGRTAELPVRKPKKAVPQRHVAMLVVVDNGQVLLEQRPGTGIWGGLLSLPEVAADEDRQRAIAQAVAPFGLLASHQQLQPFSHGFTHFKLHVAPYRVALSQRHPMAAEAGHVWYPVERLAQAPLPAPIKKLLLDLLAKADLFGAEG